MSKKRKPVPDAKRRAKTGPRRRTRRTADFAKTSWTIRFKTERELQERLDGLMMLFGGGDTAAASLEAVSTADSCLSLIQSVRIVARALEPKAFTPPEKLGETYLTSQERELFRARVIKGVIADGCQIEDSDVPADEGTTHSAVVGAVRDNAHA